MLAQQVSFNQPQRPAPPPALADGSMLGVFNLDAQRSEVRYPRTEVSHYRGRMAEGMAANSAFSCSFNPPYYVPPQKGALLAPQPVPPSTVDRIRDLLSTGKLREARREVMTALTVLPESELFLALLRLTAPSRSATLKQQYRSRDEELRWLTQHREDYKGRWVAIFGSQILASGASMKDVLESPSVKNSREIPLVHKME